MVHSNDEIVVEESHHMQEGDVHLVYEGNDEHPPDAQAKPFVHSPMKEIEYP